MYYYILDLGNRKIVKIKEKMEMLMASFGISGDFGKISPLSSAFELAQRAIRQNYKTIVAVGSGEIINQVASALIQEDAVFGIVPVDAPLSICKLVGASNYPKALEILKSRKVETIDIGKIADKKYFLTEAVIDNPKPIPTVFDFGEFKIGGAFKRIVIENGGEDRESFRDGYFQLKIDKEISQKRFFGLFQKSPAPHSSLLKGDNFRMETEEQSSVMVDSEVAAKTPCDFRLLPLALKIIVSRQSQE